MNLCTRALMVVSATFMALLGLGASFFPQEALSYAGYPTKGLAVVFVQITGALGRFTPESRRASDIA